MVNCGFFSSFLHVQLKPSMRGRCFAPTCIPESPLNSSEYILLFTSCICQEVLVQFFSPHIQCCPCLQSWETLRTYFLYLVLVHYVLYASKYLILVSFDAEVFVEFNTNGCIFFDWAILIVLVTFLHTPSIDSFISCRYRFQFYSYAMLYLLLRHYLSVWLDARTCSMLLCINQYL